MTLSTTLFELGEVVFLPGVKEAFAESREDPNLFLARHVSGDWGELSGSDSAANTLALATGGELLSSYNTSGGASFRITTEADRSKTYIYLHQGGDREELEGDIGEDELFGSFTSAVGLALGEMLVHTARPEKLRECLSQIETVAFATLVSSSPRKRSEPDGKLADASLAVVRAWHDGTLGLDEVGQTVHALQKVLEAIGIQYVAPAAETN
jgi:hypothetical protein